MQLVFRAHVAEVVEAHLFFIDFTQHTSFAALTTFASLPRVLGLVGCSRCIRCSAFSGKMPFSAAPEALRGLASALVSSGPFSFGPMVCSLASFLSALTNLS